MSLSIIFRKNQLVIAHEVVFENTFERTLTNAFRFILKSYLYHKDLALFQYSSSDNLSSNTVARHLGLSKQSCSFINKELAIKACAFFNVNFKFICALAKEFVNNPQYNAVSFTDKDQAVFFKAFKHTYCE